MRALRYWWVYAVFLWKSFRLVHRARREYGREILPHVHARGVTALFEKYPKEAEELYALWDVICEGY